MGKKTSYAYLAGLIDGEGSINISQYKASSGNIRWRAQVKVCMTDRQPIDFMAQTYGLNIYLGKTKKGKITYSCDIAAKKCVSVLDTVIPYLRAKRECAIIVRDFCNHITQYAKSHPSLPQLRNEKGQILKGAVGHPLTHEEVEYRFSAYMSVKAFQQRKSNTIQRQRLSEEARLQSKQFWMQQSELQGIEPAEATETIARLAKEVIQVTD